MSQEQRQTLKDWFFANFDHPYPSKKVKRALSDETGLSKAQISNWFMNVRKRILTPTKESCRGKSRQQLFNMMRISMDEDIVLDNKAEEHSSSDSSSESEAEKVQPSAPKLVLSIDMNKDSPKHQEFQVPKLTAMTNPMMEVVKQVQIAAQ